MEMQRRAPQKEREKTNHIVVDEEAPLDNIEEISSATTVRPDSCDEDDVGK